MIAFLKTTIYIPLYNALVWLLNFDFIDAGLAAVILTVLVKIILYPLAKKATVTQTIMKDKEKDLALIKTKYKDRQEQALKTMEFYRTNKINPLSGVFTLLIQIPIIFSLYYIFSGSDLPNIKTDLLYSFIKIPESVSMMFLGFLDVSQKSLFLAILAGASSFWQMHIASLGSKKEVKKVEIQQMGASDFAQTLSKQMKYTMPIVVFIISWKLSAIIALYWFVSNVLSVFQDMYIKKQLAEQNKTIPIQP